MSALQTSDIDLLIRGDHPDPFSVLGMHEFEAGESKNIVVRAFVPEAETLSVVEAHGGVQHPMQKIRDEGLFELTFTERGERFPYRLKAANRFGDSWEFHDP